MFPEERFLELTPRRSIIKSSAIAFGHTQKCSCFAKELWARKFVKAFNVKNSFESPWSPKPHGKDLEDDAPEENDRRRANEHYHGGGQIARQTVAFADVGGGFWQKFGQT